MRYRILLSAAAAAAGMLLLTACTASDGELAAAGAGSGQPEVSADAPAADAGQEAQAQPQEGSQDAAQDTAAAPPEETGGDSAGTSDGDAAGSTEAQSAFEPVQESDTGTAGDTAVPEDFWSGVYVGDQETVTIAMADAENISFAFAQSGISGTASVNGAQAVFRGDDYYVVVFNVNGDLLDVSVSSEEDYDASGSPLIGTYVKQ